MNLIGLAKKILDPRFYSAKIKIARFLNRFLFSEDFILLMDVNEFMKVFVNALTFHPVE